MAPRDLRELSWQEPALVPRLREPGEARVDAAADRSRRLGSLLQADAGRARVPSSSGRRVTRRS
jgi:hypothetical protein